MFVFQFQDETSYPRYTGAGQMDTLSKLMIPKEEHGLSRLTLGEIGNRVSAITIDTKKGGAVKKEILQPIDTVFSGKARVQNAFSSTGVNQAVGNHGLNPAHPDILSASNIVPVSKPFENIRKKYVFIYWQFFNALNWIYRYSNSWVDCDLAMESGHHKC